MEKLRNCLSFTIKFLLFVVALTPIVFTNKTFYPFILGKTVFFRGLAEIALFLSLIYLIFKLFSRGEEFKIKTVFFKNRLFLFFALLVISAVLSAIFAVDKYTAFWGTLERGGGLFGFLHFFIFLGLTLIFFKKSDWQKFFKLSLFVGLIAIFYGFLQFFSVNEFPFSLEPASRPGSFVGNPSFLSAYLFLVIASAVLVFSLDKILFWRIFSVFIILLSVVMLFLAATRGAILGFAIGVLALLVYFIFRSSKKYRISLIVLLAILTALVSVFWLTRFQPFWQNVPGFNRFAGISSLVPKDGSVQTRLVTWQMSLEAFKEKPIFGWGPDNYLFAWNKHYNFKLAAYGETWLDRAHNQLLDLLVMQGIFGLLIYLVLFGSIFHFLFSKKIIGRASPVLGAVLIAFFVQNLFLFDEISSYLLFIAVIGFLINTVAELRQEEDELKKGTAKNYIVSVFSAALALLILFSFYFYNYIPFRQGKNIQLARGGQKDFVKTQLIKAFYPYNFIQPSIRGYIADFYYTDRAYIFENDDFKMLSDTVLSSIQEVITHNSLDPRFYIRKSQILDIKGERDSGFYQESEEAIRKAVELAPNRQEFWYNLALSFAKQNRFDEAIALSRKIKDSNPSVGRTHFFLAFLLAVRDSQKNYAEIISEFNEINEVDAKLESLQPADVNKMAEIYLKLQEYDRLADFVMKRINGITPKAFEPKYYEFALKYFLAKRDADNFIKVADFVGKEIPAQKENMAGLADLARQRLWNILDTLP